MVELLKDSLEADVNVGEEVVFEPQVGEGVVEGGKDIEW